MRLIDADAMKDRIKNYMSVFAKKDWREICEMLNNAPTVDPVKHGHWIESLDHYDRYMCSVCGHLTNTESDNYCPHCGAKMDEVSDEID